MTETRTERFRDRNEGVYKLFGGKVSYNPNPRIHEDDTREGLGESDSAPFDSTSL